MSPPEQHRHAERAAECAAECEGIVRIYSAASGEVHALRGIGARFERGLVTAVVGPSGSGKSTLMRLLALQERPTAGWLRIAGVDATTASARHLRRLRHRIGLVQQRPSHNLFPHLTATEQLVHLARRRGAADGQVDELLERTGLSSRAAHRPDRLSGGEQQRLAVALAMLGNPALVLADEPTAELDAASARRVVGLLREAAVAGAGVVVNTHDPMVAREADTVLALHHGTMLSERHRDSETLAVIDEIGRIQLPKDALALFAAQRRARVVVESGTVRLEPVDGRAPGGAR